MKKIGILLMALAPAFTGYSQKLKELNAVNYYKDYTSTKDIQSLKQAKENVDLASVHEDTKNRAQVQVTKGQIYLALYEVNKKAQEDMLLASVPETKRAFATFENTPTTELEIALQAFQVAQTLDVKGDFKNELQLLKNVGNYFDNTGRAHLNAKNFAKALPAFEKAYEIGGYSDTTLLYYCGISAEYSDNYPKAKEYFQKLMERKYVRDNIYISMTSVYFNLKDTAAAVETMRKARTVYPNNINLVIMEANHFLRTNNSAKALNNLNIAVAARPNDPNYYLVRGNIYDNLANPKNEQGYAIDQPANSAEYFRSAESDYKKAIELKPNNFDALYNLGVLYSNDGVALNKKADDIVDNAQNAAMVAKATESYKKAIPFLEKALEINPTDKNVMFALKQIYTRLEMSDKLKEMNERLAK